MEKESSAVFNFSECAGQRKNIKYKVQLDPNSYYRSVNAGSDIKDVSKHKTLMLAHRYLLIAIIFRYVPISASLTFVNPHTTIKINSHIYLNWGPMDPKILSTWHKHLSTR